MTLALLWLWQVHKFMCHIWPLETNPSVGGPRRSAERVERRSLIKAARFFENLEWVCCDRLQLENGANSFKYLLGIYSAPSSI